MKTAVEHTAEAIATAVKGSERGVRILCDYMVTIGFLLKAEGQYSWASLAAAVAVSLFSSRRIEAQVLISVKVVNTTSAPALTSSVDERAALLRRSRPLIELSINP